MAKNITLMGANYQDVPAVDLPQTGGGTARFVDPSEFGNIVYGTNISSNVSVQSGLTAGTECSTLTLTPGKWIVIGCADWASNSSGLRQIAFADGANPGRSVAVTSPAVSGKESYQQVMQFLSVNANTDVKLYALQNSGNNLTVYPYLYAMRIVS